MSLIGAGPLGTQFQDRINDTVNKCSFQGSLDITYFLMIYPPDYSVTVSIPFQAIVGRILQVDYFRFRGHGPKAFPQGI